MASGNKKGTRKTQMSGTGKGAIILPSGKTVHIDCSGLKLGEYRDFYEPGKRAESDTTLLKVTGLTQKEFDDLLSIDFKPLVQKVMNLALGEDADPN